MYKVREDIMYNGKNHKPYLAFNSACERFANRYVMAEVASQIGMSQQVLRNKLNPEQHHHLYVYELIALYQATHDESLIDGALLECGLTAVRLPEAKEDAQLLKRAIELNAMIGGIGQQALQIVEKGRVTRTQRNMLVDAATVALGDLLIFINEVEAKFQMVPSVSSAQPASRSLSGW
jgi:AraC-like DNA-binding protein